MPELQSHVLYANHVLEDMLNELLETNLNAMNLMTINTELAGHAGMTKKVLVYNFEGQVEEVGRGQGNTVVGKLAHQPKEYTVGTAQQMINYADEDVMIEPKVVEYQMQGAAKVMANHMNEKYIAELGKASLTLNATGEALSYDLVVDALEAMEANGAIVGALGERATEGAFLLINPAQKAELRKDADFKAAAHGEILFTGQIGSVAGLPVISSRLVPEGEAYVATRKAVTCFVKKESEVEQDRDINTRVNTVVMRKVNLVALTDESQVVKINLK